MKNGVKRSSKFAEEIWTKDYEGYVYHRTDGPARIYQDGSMGWHINGFQIRSNKDYQLAAGLSDDVMTLIILKYGDIK